MSSVGSFFSYIKLRNQKNNFLKRKKLPFLAHAVNSVWYQAAVTQSKSLLLRNMGCTWMTKQIWIRVTFRNGAIVVDVPYYSAKEWKDNNNRHSANHPTFPPMYSEKIQLIIFQSDVSQHFDTLVCQCQGDVHYNRHTKPTMAYRWNWLWNLSHNA